MKRQFVITHKILQAEIPALLDSWVTNTPSVKSCFSLYFRRNITRLSVGILGIGQVFSVSCKTVCRRVTTNCSFMTDIVFLPPHPPLIRFPVRNSEPLFPYAHRTHLSLTICVDICCYKTQRHATHRNMFRSLCHRN
jgi:hypothetical protein